MKKTTFIILGLISIILLGVWVYLLFFHNPDSENNLFTNFGWFTDQETTPIIVEPSREEEIPLINVKGPRLRQLTTKPVAGYVEVHSTSTEPYFIRYVEAGLGHIYELNMSTGEEIRISNTTIPQAQQALFSIDGTKVAIKTDTTARSQVTVGNVGNGEFNGQVLPTTVADVNFSDNGELYYSEVPTTGTNTFGKALNLDNNTTRDLFTIPFRSATVGWAKAGLTSHYIYTKPASRLLGYMYSISNSTIVREPITGNGLNVIANDDYIVYSVRIGESHLSYSYNRNTKTYQTLPILAIPEKCVFSQADSNTLFCGFEYTFYDYKFPDTWYKGQISFNDSLWRINLDESSVGQMVIPKQVIGRELDTTTFYHSTTTNMLYFINKYDKILWVYELLAN